MEFKDSKTKKNLETAFAGESQARNKYIYFASVAKKEGFEQIAQIFVESAENEKEHAKIWFKYLEGIKNTAENLKTAISGENYEYTTMYKQFAEEAEKEGFLEIAEKFRLVVKIEKEHEKRFSKIQEFIFGNAEIVDISIVVLVLHKYAQFVRINNLILNLLLKIINFFNFFSEEYSQKSSSHLL